ncbi:protein kinase domain-containing protein [Robbsia andropogonis]|uniref:protein kinase domain-containing protein n=1 Tax=Robbsia andropogonis TaxID=28092 RepID=UPI002A6A7BA2|nr:hypothetical protein [Robbsia andropogonis]
MPSLDDAVIQDLEKRLVAFLKKKNECSVPELLDAGGSAAVFKVTCAGELRAFKVFEPKFLSGPSGPAERRRLDVQRRLVSHDCPNLVKVFEISEAEDTAFTEMEFIDWPQLAKSLSSVPDEHVHSLISQLVVAVQYLDELNIVHRDIKPENSKRRPKASC